MSKWKVDIMDIKFKVGCIEFKADCCVSMFADPHYGADADGNRGIYREEITEVNITALQVGPSARPVEITKYTRKYQNIIYDKLEEAIDKNDLSKPKKSPRIDIQRNYL